MVVLPSSGFLFWIFVCCEFYGSRCRGELQGRFLLYSRSPLCVFSFCCVFLSFYRFQMSGRINRRGDYYTLVLPLWTGILILGWNSNPIFIHVGEITQGSFLKHSRSPIYDFKGVNLMGSQGLHYKHRAQVWPGMATPYIVYI